MKAALVEKPGSLVVRDIPAPQPGPYDALCELLYGATCAGTDLHLIEGRFPWKVTYPTVLGHESIGRVARLGEKVRNYRVGDLVTRVGTVASPTGEFAVNWGGFAQYGIARDHRAMKEDGLDASLWRAFRVNQVLPADADPAAATMVITWRETFSFSRRMGVGPGTSALVIGSGGNGLAFAAHAHNLGAERVAMLGSAAREDVARRAGAADYFDYRRPDAAEAVRARHAEGFDVIIDAVGKRDSADAALPLLKAGGRVAVYGVDEYHEVRLNPRRARGTFTVFAVAYDEAEAHEEVLGFMRAGRLKAELWLDLDRPFELADIGAAFEAVKSKRLVKALVRLG